MTQDKELLALSVLETADGRVDSSVIPALIASDGIIDSLRTRIDMDQSLLRLIHVCSWRFFCCIDVTVITDVTDYAYCLQ